MGLAEGLSGSQRGVSHRAGLRLVAQAVRAFLTRRVPAFLTAAGTAHRVVLYDILADSIPALPQWG